MSVRAIKLLIAIASLILVLIPGWIVMSKQADCHLPATLPLYGTESYPSGQDIHLDVGRDHVIIDPGWKHGEIVASIHGRKGKEVLPIKGKVARFGLAPIDGNLRPFLIVESGSDLKVSIWFLLIDDRGLQECALPDPPMPVEIDSARMDYEGRLVLLNVRLKVRQTFDFELKSWRCELLV